MRDGKGLAAFIVYIKKTELFNDNRILHWCRRFGRLTLTDRSVGHGRFRWSVRFHLRDNTVDINGRLGYTYGELRSISTVGSVHSTQNDHVGRFIPKLIGRRSISTVEVDIHTKKPKKVLIFEKNCKDVPPTTCAFFLGLGFDTATLEFWVPLEKAQVFADGCKDLLEPLDRVIVLALLARQRWRAGLWTSCCIVIR